MPLEHSHGHSRESNQKLGHGAAFSISRRSAAFDAFGGSFRTTARRIKPETLYFSSGFITCKGKFQIYHCVYIIIIKVIIKYYIRVTKLKIIRYKLCIANQMSFFLSK